MSSSAHYVDNAEFYREMVEFRSHCDSLPKDVRPKVPDKIGAKIMLICQRLSFSRDFIGSPHREEMVLDAIENCILYIRNFDPSKSRNPFAYFTQIAYFAFIRRAQREKRHLTTKIEYAATASVADIIEHANAAASDSASGDADTFIQLAGNLSNYLAHSMNRDDQWRPEEKDGQHKRKKKTTLEHQKRLREREEAAKAALSDDPEIEAALSSAIQAPEEAVTEDVSEEVDNLKIDMDADADAQP